MKFVLVAVTLLALLALNDAQRFGFGGGRFGGRFGGFGMRGFGIGGFGGGFGGGLRGVRGAVTCVEVGMGDRIGEDTG